MKKPAFISIAIALYVGLLIVLTSCDTKKTKTNSAAADSTVTAESSTARTPISSLDFNLYPLYVTSATFVTAVNSTTVSTSKKKPKLLLQFIIASSGSANYLSLEGWFPEKSTDAEDFDSNSDIQLTKIISTTTNADVMPIANSTYFGNLFVNGGAIKKIYKQAVMSTPENRYIVFFPNVQNGHIQYNIGFSPTITNPTKPITTGGADFIANPTPPRQYEIN